MNRAANVRSVEHIRDLRISLINFEGNARDAVELLTMEVRRALDWIENDRRRYWPDQVKKASGLLAEKRNDLERCQMRFGTDEPPSCYEQKKALERARQRQRYCEDQVRVTKRWIRAVRAEMTEFEGQIAQMVVCLDTELPRAIATLGRMLGALEKYAHERQQLDAAADPLTARSGNASSPGDSTGSGATG
ncbi:MAG: hypothetical protein CMJ64_15575 [Planctomycetaceae bacterium]|nr:hypothetical protein [Planctomycetaceae bacterium]